MPLFPPTQALFIADYLECNVKFLEDSYKEAKFYCLKVLKEKPNPIAVENLIITAYETKDKKLLEELIAFLERKKFNKAYLFEAKALLALLENNEKEFPKYAKEALLYGSQNRILLDEVLKKYLLKDWDLTVLALFRLYSLKPKDNLVQLALNLLYAKPKEVYEIYKQLKFKDENITYLVAKILNRVGNEEEALKLTEEVLKENPNFDKAKKLLIDIYLSRGNLEKALEVADENGLLKRYLYEDLLLNYSYLVGKKLFFKALKEFSDDKELVSYLLIFSLSQNWEEGILKSGEVYAKLVKKPTEKDLKLLTGYFVAEISTYGDIKEKELFEELKKKFPKSSDLLLVEALLEFKRGNLKGFEEKLKEINSESLTPIYKPVYEALRLYTLKGEGLKRELSKLKEEEFSKVLYAAYRVISPKFSEKLAEVYLKLKPTKEAFGLAFVTFNELGDEKLQAKVLEEALKHYPNDAAFLNSLGYTYLLLYGKGKLAEAKALIEKALKIDPNDPATIDSLGWVYYLEGDYKKAEKLLRKALEQTPNDPVVNYHYAAVLIKLGKTCEAKKYLEKSLKALEDSIREPEEGITEKVEKTLKEVEEICNTNR